PPTFWKRAADTVFVRTLSGDLQLGTSVTSTSGADLVAAARFQNVGGASLGGAPWRVWADTWVGETRGGLAGSGLLPNLYNCAYLGLCTVAVTPGDNHFIYARQPVATVVANNATRPFGFPNPVFTYGITGLILGDTGASFNGLLSTTAGLASLPGAYPINGTFASAAGYAVNVVPGTLRVSTAIDMPKVDVLRDLPTSYLYDRNIGQAPICLATGPLDGDRAQQGADVLAREWSRVRSRPNLLNCVDTERRNGCADF
ncbi:MAG: hemagglutinin, partial [Comamonadaceae bacterium]